MFISNSGSRGYTIANSLRLRSSASAYLSRTPGVAGNRTTWTWSGWVKRGALGSNQALFSATSDGTQSNEFLVWFGATDVLNLQQTVAGSSAGQFSCVTNAVYRDPSAYMHIVVSMDSSNGTAGNRVRLWANNTLLTFSSYSANSVNTWINNNNQHAIGKRSDASLYLDGYLSDIYFIDGQALTPSSFGQTDTNGVWVPKAYSGTYGTNGFYLKFNDGSNTTNLCLDRSGNGNNWTPSGISVSAGSTYDWMVDTPTNNYAVLNAVQDSGSLTNANLRFAGVAGYSGRKATTALPSSGKWYWEYTITTQNVAAGNWTAVGMCTGSLALTTFAGAVSGAVFYGDRNDQRAIYNETSTVSTSATIDFATNDVLQCAYDADTGKFWFGKNNAWWDSSVGTTGNPSAGTNQTLTAAAKEWFPFVQHNEANNTTDVNLGQRPFTYTPPTGFKALCTANLPAVTIANPKKHFDAIPYVGNGGTKSVTGAAFQPDFVWLKSRGQAYSNVLGDAVRGAGKILYSNATNAEDTGAYIASFDSSGFTVNVTPGVAVNQTSDNIISWLWKANGAGVTNTSGSITSTVSANTAAGFSIVTYTGTGANATVGHGLGTVPKMVIVKNRTGASVAWRVWHTALAGTEGLELNGTSAKFTETTLWNSTVPTSTVFSVGSSSWTNQNTLVAYVFSEVPGFSRFGSYTGNGSADGPFVFTGFQPRYILVKASAGTSAATSNWIVLDTARETYNQMTNYLSPNLSAAETGGPNIDVTANGFKLRNSGTGTNENNSTYIYAAFASSPFGGQNVSPAVAR